MTTFCCIWRWQYTASTAIRHGVMFVCPLALSPRNWKLQPIEREMGRGTEKRVLLTLNTDDTLLVCVFWALLFIASLAFLLNLLIIRLLSCRTTLPSRNAVAGGHAPGHGLGAAVSYRAPAHKPKFGYRIWHGNYWFNINVIPTTCRISRSRNIANLSCFSLYRYPMVFK